MKSAVVLFFCTTVMISFPCMASIAIDSEKQQATNDIAEAFIKGGMLTDSLTEKAQANPELAGQQIAKELTAKLNQVVVQGINQGEDCDSIAVRVENFTSQAFAPENNPHINEASPAALKAMKKLPLATKRYAKAQCQYLNE